MRITTMNGLLRRVLRKTVIGITLPPFGVYLRPGHEAEPGLQAHEAVHWAQYERMGLARFYVTYVWQWLKHGSRDHPMEIEARQQSGV